MRLAVLILLFSLLAVAAATHRLPLFKHKSSVASKLPNGRYNSKFSSLLTGALNDPVKSDGSGFTVQVQIGTPAQLFDAQVAFDSAELWIADSSCQYWIDCQEGCGRSCTKFGCGGCCYAPAQCPVEVPFNSSLSSTYHTEGRLWKMSDGLSGIVGYDAITLDADVSLPVGEFVQVTSLHSWTAPCYGQCENDMSGVLGLGLAGLSPTGTSSIFQQAFEAGTVEKAFVGLWMNRSADSREGEVVGELTFGDWDHEKCSQSMVFVPIAGPDARWKISVDGAQIGTYDFANAWRAVLDPSFGSWNVPKALYKAVIAATGAVYEERVGDVVYCDQDTPLILTTEGGDIVIPFSAFSYHYDAHTCVLDIYQGYGQEDELIFGYKFFTLFCAVFDYEKQWFGYAAIN